MNWEEVQLIELLETLESGSRPKGGVRGIMDGVPSVGGEHLNDNGGFDFSNIKYIPKSFAEKMSRGKIEEGDILIVKDGATTGKTSYIDLNFPYKKAFVNEHVFICRPSKEIHSKYLYWFLKGKEGNERIMENFKGSAQGGINQTFASNTLVPLAPLPEQQRIVAKLDALMEKIERSRSRMEKIPLILKRFRQSILSAAVSGKLTEEWRGSDDDVERIPLGELITGLKYGTSQKSEKEKKGTPILRIPNISDGVINIQDLKYSELQKKEYEALKLIPGDILLIRSNGSVSLVGKTAIVTDKEKGFAYAGYLIRLRCNVEKILPEFLNLAFGSFDLRIQIEVPARSTSGVNNINSSEVRALEIPTPSIEEQKVIVKRVERLFGTADKIESRYNKAKAQLDKLPQSLLAKAFRGELVAQNPNDEPASVLLERIREEREKVKVTKPKEKTGIFKKRRKLKESDSYPMSQAAEPKHEYVKTKGK